MNDANSEVKVPEDCRQQYFYNVHGSTGALVCSCGFAITFPVMGPSSEAMARDFFDRQHYARKQERDQLRASLLEHCVFMEYDYPGYVPVPCGYYCSLCHCPVNDDKVTGHRKDCVLNGSQAPATVAEFPLPAAGWRCTRSAGHDGPCAAVQIPIRVPADAEPWYSADGALYTRPECIFTFCPHPGNCEQFGCGSKRK